MHIICSSPVSAASQIAAYEGIGDKLACNKASDPTKMVEGASGGQLLKACLAKRCVDNCLSASQHGAPAGGFANASSVSYLRVSGVRAEVLYLNWPPKHPYWLRRCCWLGPSRAPNRVFLGPQGRLVIETRERRLPGVYKAHVKDDCSIQRYRIG